MNVPPELPPCAYLRVLAATRFKLVPVTHFATDANPRAANTSGLPTQALVVQPIMTIHDKIRHRAYLSTSRRPLCSGMFSLIMHNWSFLPKHGRGRCQTCKQATGHNMNYWMEHTSSQQDILKHDNVCRRSLSCKQVFQNIHILNSRPKHVKMYFKI